MDEPDDERPPLAAHDLVLMVLNMAINDGPENGHIGITLTVGGTAVDGVLVGAGRWFDEVTAGVESAGATEAANALRLIAGQRFPADGDVERVREASQAVTDPAYLHLLNATLLGPNGQRVTTPRPWRGRIEFVAGWSFSSTSLDTP